MQSVGVGVGGSGFLAVSDGAWVEISDQPFQEGDLTIGSLRNDAVQLPVGQVQVEGESTLLRVAADLTIGHGVATSLYVSDAASVRVGNAVEISGTAVITGQRTELRTDRLALGGAFGHTSGTVGSGSLRIEEGAIVRPYRSNALTRTETSVGSRIVLAGGTFALPLMELHGVLEGFGMVTQTIGVERSGAVLVNTSETLDVLGSIESVGSVTVTGGVLNVYGRYINEDQRSHVGRTTISSGQLRLQGGLHNEGSIDLSDSVLKISQTPFDNFESMLGGDITAVGSRIELSTRTSNYGRLELVDSELIIDAGPDGLRNMGSGAFDSGRIVLENSSFGAVGCCGFTLINSGVVEARRGENQMLGAVRDSGEGRLEVGPDASITFGSAQFYGGVTVEGGGLALFQYNSQIRDIELVVGDENRIRANLIAVSDGSNPRGNLLAVSGRLSVADEGLTSLAADQVYKLIEADRLVGDISEYDLPDLPGTLEFLPQLTETELSLLVIDTIQTLPGDFSGDGRVDAADYTLWRDGLPGGSRWLDHAVWSANFGRTLSSPAAAVPEPAACAIAALGLFARFRRPA